MTDDSTDEIDHANSAKMVVTIGGFNRNKKKSRLRVTEWRNLHENTNDVVCVSTKYLQIGKIQKTVQTEGSFIHAIHNTVD